MLKKKENYGYASFSYVSLHLNYSFLCAHSFHFPFLSVTASPSLHLLFHFSQSRPTTPPAGFSSPLSFPSTQGMRSQAWWRWGPYMRLHGSNHRMTALSCETSLCRTLSRASSVQPGPSASKSSMSESPLNLHKIQYNVCMRSFLPFFKVFKATE